MLPGIAHSHLGLEDPQEFLLHIMSAKPNGGDHRRQFWRLELLADVVDQVDQMFFVFVNQHFSEAVLVALEPDETGNLVALIPVPGDDLGNVAQGLAHALDHQLIFG